jgi:RND family efflux transporter MFP subunit
VAALAVVPQSGYERARRFVGRVEAGRASELGFVAGGRLDDIRVDEGDSVAAGELLARLDTGPLEARRAELVADRKAAEARLDRAGTKLKRRETMVDRGATSREEVEQAREQFRTAEASVELARARIVSIDVDLDRAGLRAPYAAVVTRRYVDEGRVVAAGTPILTVQEVAAPVARIGVAGPLVDAVAEGQQVDVQIQGENQPGRIRAVLPVRDAGTRTVDVILSLQASDRTLRAGDLVTLTLTQPVSEAGYWLPVNALAEGVRGLWTAYQLQSAEAAGLPGPTGVTHTVVPVTVEILHTTADRAYVRGDLSRHALVIANGVHRVVPGQVVRLAEGRTVAVNAGGHRHGRL